MAKKTLDQLTEMSYEQLDDRLRVLKEQVDARIMRCQTENRDFELREVQLTEDARLEISAIRDAIMSKDSEAQQREHTRDRMQLIGRAIEQRGAMSPLFPSAHNLAALEEARGRMATVSLIEERTALKTTDMGTAVEYGPSGLQAPRTLWRSSGIPTTQPPAGYAAVVPQFTLPVGTALVAEGNAHAEFDDVAPDSVQLRRTGAWSDLTAEGLISTSLTEITAAHARIIARDLDLALVDKLEGTDSGLDIDEALVTVAAEAAADVSQLWIVGDPASISTLVGVASAMTPTNAGDVGSYAVRYGGAALYPTPAATTLTVFHPGSFRAFSTPLASAVVTDPTTGSQRFGQWQLFGVGQTLVGAALTVGGSGSGS